MKLKNKIAVITGSGSGIGKAIAKRFALEGATIAGDGTAHLDAAVQSAAVLANVERVLIELGLDRTDLVDATAFLVDMGDFEAWNSAWAAFFDGVEAPARTTVGVRALPHPHLLVEVKATARLRDRG